MAKKRNGLLDLYRIFFCFWVLYFHHFFFFENPEKIYREAYLAVEFFFVLSGIFLLNSIKRTDGLPFWKGCGKLMWGRLKPIAWTLAVVFCFNLTGIIVLATRDGFDFQIHVGTVFYLWFLPFMFFGVFMMYVLYRLIKNKYAYLITLAILTVAGYAVEFGVNFSYHWTDQLPLSIARSLGGVSLGVLISRIPVVSLRFKKIISIIFSCPYSLQESRGWRVSRETRGLAEASLFATHCSSTSPLEQMQAARYLILLAHSACVCIFTWQYCVCSYCLELHITAPCSLSTWHLR